ncbi:MAG: acyl-CoA reductase [Bacteroidia bacterium]
MHQRISAFVELGKRIQKLLHAGAQLLNGNAHAYRKFESAVIKANYENQWFTKANVIRAFEGIAILLQEKELNDFVESYSNQSSENINPKRVGVIMAGNIPMVGFHDLMCVLLSGNKLVAKLANDDKVLMNYLIEQLIEIDPALKSEIQITDRLADFDAVIATGNNNSARYFEYYFGKYPHIIRKNRNAIAILDGTETTEELRLLGEDLFTYFGLGCRNVSKLYVPLNYNFNLFFESIQSFAPELLDHNKYLNNFDYHNALFLLEKIPFLTNNFIIIRESEVMATPVSVLNYEYYNDVSELTKKLIPKSEKIQCIVSNKKINLENSNLRSFYFGEAQKPEISDFADGVDTMGFLVNLKLMV